MAPLLTGALPKVAMRVSQVALGEAKIVTEEPAWPARLSAAGLSPSASLSPLLTAKESLSAYLSATARVQGAEGARAASLRQRARSATPAQRTAPARTVPLQRVGGGGGPAEEATYAPTSSCAYRLALPLPPLNPPPPPHAPFLHPPNPPTLSPSP